MPETDFSLKLSGTGLSLDQKVSKELATRIMLLVLGDGTDSDGLRPGGKPPLGGSELTRKKLPSLGAATSLREFLNQHDAKKIPQQIAAIGSYLETTNGIDSFTTKALLSGFKDAKVLRPGNPARDIARTVSLGWIAPAGTRGQYYVTGTGQSAIESNFIGKMKGGRADRRRGKRVRKAAKKASK
jgi:hypothetical protein